MLAETMEEPQHGRSKESFWMVDQVFTEVLWVKQLLQDLVDYLDDYCWITIGLLR